MKLIVAMDKNRGIGYKGNLLCRLPLDMENFKKITTENGVMIMGRKTFESIGRALPNRLSIILSSKGISYEPKKNDGKFICLSSVDDIITYLYDNDLFEKACVIGGASIYKLFMNYCSDFYITKIDKSFDNVDTYFPEIDQNNELKLIDSTECFQFYNNQNISFITFTINHYKIDRKE